MSNQSGERFQDRKLNACARCGTKKQLGLTVADNGSVFFLCKADSLLLELTEKAVLEKQRRIR